MADTWSVAKNDSSVLTAPNRVVHGSGIAIEVDRSKDDEADHEGRTQPKKQSPALRFVVRCTTQPNAYPAAMTAGQGTNG